ncbi:MAG: amidohydrolase family protein [Balneolaceae bacterium]
MTANYRQYSLFSTLFLAFFTLCSGTVSLSAQDGGSLLLRNATVIPVTGDDLPDTDIMIVDGLIQAIGQNLAAPEDIEVIDASDKYIMPGIVDAHSHLNSIGVNESSHPVTPEVTMAESIDPNSVAIYRALAGGVTTINLMHGSANVIGGRNVTLKLRYGRSQYDMIMEGAPQTVKFALGENPTRVHGQDSGVQPRTRMGVEQVIREYFDAAIDYRSKRDDYLAMKREYDQNPDGIPPVPVPENLRLEVILDILDGNIIVHAHSYRADEIFMLTRIFSDYGITGYTFQHANEAFKVAPELREAGAHASIFSDWWAYKFEVYYSTAYSATILNENEVVTSIHSDSNELIRHLNLEAAKSMRYGGTSENDAIRMITLNPAKQLGIDDRVGSLEIGKEGDLSVWSGHPLSIYSVNELTVIDGNIYFDRSSDPDDMRIRVSPSVDYHETEYSESIQDHHFRINSGLNQHQIEE